MSESSSPSDIREIPIRDESIRLGQLLKLAGVVDSGIDAKETIEAGDVYVNGAVELRRGRQIRPGDEVTCLDLLTSQLVTLHIVSGAGL